MAWVRRPSICLRAQRTQCSRRGSGNNRNHHGSNSAAVSLLSQATSAAGSPGAGEKAHRLQQRASEEARVEGLGSVVLPRHPLLCHLCFPGQQAARGEALLHRPCQQLACTGSRCGACCTQRLREESSRGQSASSGLRTGSGLQFLVSGRHTLGCHTEQLTKTGLVEALRRLCHCWSASRCCAL